VGKKTKLIYCESVGNPNGAIVDFAALRSLEQRYSLLFVIDNTLTPLLFEPLTYADIAIYSTTKILSGHSQALGGAVVFRKVDEDDRLFANFAFMKSFFEKSGPKAFLPLLKKRALRDIGMSQNAFGAALTLLGLETLALRVKRTSESAKKIASHFKEIANYAGFHPLAKTYMPRGAGQMLTFDLGSKERAYRFLRSSKMVYITANLGDARTLALAMGDTIYKDFTPEQKSHLGITEGLVRLSIGLENVDMLIEDFQKALKGTV
jgi:O-acetylhomoserine (thiol)-lyase